MEKEKQYTYTSAFEELQQIVREIERGEILIDELSVKVKKAKALIEICNSKLTETEADVNKLLANFAAQKPEEEE
jgi:exodeoxyribonuclease VII small subunit